MAQRLHGQVLYATGEATGAVSVLVAAALDLCDDDRSLARDTLLDALSAAQLAGSSPQPGESYADVSRLARRMPLTPGVEPTVADRLLDAAAAVHLEGAVAAGPLLRTALAEVEALGTTLNEQGRPTEQVRWLGLGCWTAGVLADDVRQLELARRLEQVARPHGALASLAVGLLHLAMVRLGQGLLPVARDHLAERAALQEAMGWPADFGELVARAWAGDADGARTEAARVAALAAASHHGWMLVFSDYAASVLEVGLGHYSAAVEPASRTYWENPSLAVVAFPNLVEAAVRADAGDLVIAASADLAARTGDDAEPARPRAAGDRRRARRRAVGGRSPLRGGPAARALARRRRRRPDRPAAR